MPLQTLTPVLEHTPPDVEIIRSTRRRIKSGITALDDIYLPVLKEKLRTLYNNLNQVEDRCQEALSRLPVVFRSNGIDAMLQSMFDMDEESPLRALHIAELTDYIDSTLERVAELTTALSQSLDAVNVFDPGETEGFVADMEQLITSEQAELERINQQYGRTRKDKDTINAAMAVLEDKNLFDELQPLIEAFKHMNPNKPVYSVIRAGVAGVQNILHIASESAKYSDMVEARSEVQKQLNTLVKQQSDTQRQIATLRKRLQQLNTLAPLSQHKAHYERELRKLPRALEALLAQQQSLPRTDMVAYARIFIAQTSNMAVYLEDLRNRWK